MAYYTLEAAQGGGTALCSWDAAGVHLQPWQRPPPALDDFPAELVVRLQSPGMPDADGADLPRPPLKRWTAPSAMRQPQPRPPAGAAGAHRL
ncbi:MAG: hypothetical protein IPK34_17175 [Ramlibacter sp.]|nr:hypothetical protein [Ramlibacter sp.]